MLKRSVSHAATVVLLCMCPTLLYALDTETYCASMYQCLQVLPECCPPDFTQRPAGITYDKEDCSVFHDLHAAGVNHDTPLGRTIFEQLSSKYRVTYRVAGTLPVSFEIADYFMRNLPFTAHLINAYQNARYCVTYLNKSHSRFSASRGDNLRGVFSVAVQNSKNRHNVYFGSGTAEILMWKLGGSVVADISFKPISASSITYELTCLAFPANFFVQSIMEFFLFKKIVSNQLKSIIGDVEHTAERFFSGDRRPLGTSPYFNTPAGAKLLESFTSFAQTSTMRSSP